MTSGDPISVLIADDHPLLRSGIAGVLASDPRFRVVGEADDGIAAVTRSLQAGASGYILKNLTRTDLIDYILSIHAGGRHLPPQVASALAGSFQSDSLSKREIEGLKLVAGGNTHQRVGLKTAGK
eukprot:gene34975-39551_t